MPECSVSECIKPHFCHGFCGAHYSRWKRHGDPLKGRTAEGAPLAYFADTVLNFEGDECLTWPFGCNSDGYAAMWRAGQMRSVCRVICEILYGTPEIRVDAAHSCGNGHLGCVNKKHLSWKTVTENSADRIVHGTHTRGERHGESKLTEQQVLQIIELKGVVTQSALAEKLHVSPQTISDIQRGKRWSWLTNPEAKRLAEVAA